MNEMALNTPDTQGVFLFEDHNIARVGFLLPANCRKVNTRAWPLFWSAAVGSILPPRSSGQHSMRGGVSLACDFPLDLRRLLSNVGVRGGACMG
jgi:hypothetical protein